MDDLKLGIQEEEMKLFSSGHGGRGVIHFQQVSKWHLVGSAQRIEKISFLRERRRS